MKRWCALLLILSGCNAATVAPPGTGPLLSLSRTPDGLFTVELTGASSAPRALTAEILIDSPSALMFSDPQEPAGLALDTVRLSPRGTNRAILFSGDKRGVLLSASGPVARFLVAAPSGTSLPAEASLRIASAQLVGTDGQAIPLRLGPAIPAR